MLRIAKCVWGGEYVGRMLEWNIPSLSSAMNIQEALKKYKIRHVIYTTSEDSATIEKHPSYLYLSGIVDSRIVIVDDAEVTGVYEDTIARMNAIHRRILGDCRAAGETWLFDQPDHVWAAGSIPHLCHLSTTTGKAVMFAGVRTRMEDMLSDLRAHRTPEGTVIEVEPQRLAALALRHMHQHDSSRFWGCVPGNNWTQQLSWRVGPGAFLRRTFFPQPFAMPPTDAVSDRSVDLDFAEKAFPVPDDLVFVSDTTDFMVAELTRTNLYRDAVPHPITLCQAGAWAGSIATDYQAACFARPIRFGEAPETRWRHVTAFASRCERAILAYRRFHALQAAVQDKRPALACLIGQMLRDERALARLKPPESFTLLVPPDAAIGKLLAAHPLGRASDWTAEIARHIVSGNWSLEDLRLVERVETLAGSAAVSLLPSGEVAIGNIPLIGEAEPLPGLRVLHLADVLPASDSGPIGRGA